MGKTIKPLAESKLPLNKIFNNRFVVEMCETMHVHYRNVRILLNRDNWEALADGFRSSLLRWKQQGKPEDMGHLELCRRRVYHDEEREFVKVNLNENLYLKHADMIFSEGAEDFKDKQYIHLKYRDIRIEMPVEEFHVFADTVKEAQEKLSRKEVLCEA